MEETGLPKMHSETAIKNMRVCAFVRMFKKRCESAMVWFAEPETTALLQQCSGVLFPKAQGSNSSSVCK